MRQGLETANRRFAGVLATTAVGLFLCFPRWEDGRRLEVLDTLEALSSQLDADALERALEQQAERGAVVGIAEVGKATRSPDVEGLRWADEPAVLFEADEVEIASLEEYARHAAGGAELTAHGPDLEQLAESLRWRLVRHGKAGELRLTGLTLVEGGVDAAQLAVETSVEPNRQAVTETRDAAVKARGQWEWRQDRAKAIIKRRAPKKAQWEAITARREAWEAKQAAEAARDAAMKAYTRSLEQAERFRPRHGATAGVLVQATLEHESGPPVTFTIPAPRVEQTLVSQPVPVPPALKALTETAMWPELEDLTLAEAQAYVKDQLSWHLWGGKLGPIRVGSATLLHLFPLLPMLALFRLAVTCRETVSGYSPFGQPDTDLPRPGTGNAKRDAVLLVAPLVVVVLLDLVTLFRIDGQSWIVLFTGGASIAYALRVTREWEGLLDTRNNILRTSIPPPSF